MSMVAWSSEFDPRPGCRKTAGRSTPLTFKPHRGWFTALTGGLGFKCTRAIPFLSDAKPQLEVEDCRNRPLGRHGLAMRLITTENRRGANHLSVMAATHASTGGNRPA
jgi:hypothetical protein